MSCHVTSRHVVSRHVVLCRIVSMVSCYDVSVIRHLGQRTSCAMAAEARRLSAGAADRDGVHRFQWLQQELQQKSRENLRSLAVACGLQQRATSVDALRKRLLERRDLHQSG